MCLPVLLKEEYMYTLWLDYRTEGWKPEDFSSLEELTKAVKEGGTFGQPFRVTIEYELVIGLQKKP